MSQYKLSGFADEAGKTAEEQMRVLGLNGIFSIELRSIDGKNVLDLTETELLALKRKFEERGFSVSAIGSPIGKTPIEEDFSFTMTAFEKALKAAEILDTTYIRAFSFYIPKETDPMRWADEVISRLTELVNTADKKGKRYVLENESGIFTNIPSCCAYVTERIPGLSLVFDPSNFIMNDADCLQAWNLLKKKVTYFHIKDATRNPRHPVPAGEGEGCIAEILKDAYTNGFDNFLSVEPHLGYLDNLNDAQRFTTAANALKRLLNSALGASLEEVDIRSVLHYRQS